MPQLTTTSHAILGLLALRDWTTYELAQQMQRRLDFVWPRAERKLYDEPKRLVDAGYATSVKEMTGRRARTVYSITPEGRTALRRWLGTPIEPPSFEFEGMVRVLFSDQGDLAQLRQTLQRIDEQATAGRLRFTLMLEGLADSDDALADRQHITELGIKFMLGHYDNIREWTKWAVAETSGWTDTTSPKRATETTAPTDATEAPVAPQATQATDLVG